jgi:hypothetical protein
LVKGELKFDYELFDGTALLHGVGAKITAVAGIITTVKLFRVKELMLYPFLFWKTTRPRIGIYRHYLTGSDGSFVSLSPFLDEVALFRAHFSEFNFYSPLSVASMASLILPLIGHRTRP